MEEASHRGPRTRFQKVKQMVLLKRRLFPSDAQSAAILRKKERWILEWIGQCTARTADLHLDCIKRERAIDKSRSRAAGSKQWLLICRGVILQHHEPTVGAAQRLVRAAEMLARHRLALRQKWVWETQQIRFLRRSQVRLGYELEGFHDALISVHTALAVISARRAEF